MPSGWNARTDLSAGPLLLRSGRVATATVEFTAEVQVLAVSLFERVSQSRYFFSVPPLQAGDLTGQACECACHPVDDRRTPREVPQ